MLLLTEDGIIAARDRWGRTPIVIGKKDGAGFWFLFFLSFNEF